MNFPKRLSIGWLQQCYQAQRLTPYEVMQEILRRVQQHADNPIWITRPSEEMVQPYLQRLQEMDPLQYPLWGIPFAIKDNIDLAGVPTTAACAAYAYTPKKSAYVVQKLIEAGAIPIGKTNLDQFATGLVGTRSFYGEVKNSLRPELISGGSSSGSAVAVSLGLCAFALGTDTAGSGRVPAALNHLIGYKSSLGAWSTQGVVPACASLDTVTVFTDHLADAELVDRCVRGFDKDCCWSREVPYPDKKRPKRICLPENGLEFFGRYQKEYQNKWQQAVQRIKRIGLPIEEIPIDSFRRAASLLYNGPWIAERWYDLGEFVTDHPGEIFPVTENILRSGDIPAYTAAKTFGAIHELQRYKAAAWQLLQDAVLMMPTVGGTFTRDEVRADPVRTNSQLGLYTNHCNLLDLCAVAVPSDTELDTLPFGITLFGRADHEGRVLKVAEEFLDPPFMELAVCGLHMKGMPLASQLLRLGAEYVETCQTAAAYRMVYLDLEPARPGLIGTQEGTSVEVDLYRLPKPAWGSLLETIQAPLGIGDIKLLDGRVVKGFLCEAQAASAARDISSSGGWRNFLRQHP